MTGASSGATRIGSTAPQALEFFAGIGLARLGLEEAGFHVAWSNDIDHAKCQMYRNQFGNNEQEHTLIEGDMGELHGSDLPHDISIAWGSSLYRYISGWNPYRVERQTVQRVLAVYPSSGRDGQ